MLVNTTHWVIYKASIVSLLTSEVPHPPANRKLESNRKERQSDSLSPSRTIEAVGKQLNLDNLPHNLLLTQELKIRQPWPKLGCFLPFLLSWYRLYM